MKKTRLVEGECIISYDVTGLFTSIPVTYAIEIIRYKWEQDTELHKRTTMSANNIWELLEFCLCNTFLFQDQFYEQTKGAAMGSPVSPIIANLYVKSFEHRALTSAVNPPKLWKIYVDVAFVILQQSQKEFLQNINSVDPSISFTTEETRHDGSMPYLDTLVTPQKDGTLTTSVYRKPTHSDLYLQWDSHHNLACKCSVINTHTHRAKAECSNSQAARKKLKHLKKVLTQCKCPSEPLIKYYKSKTIEEQKIEETKVKQHQPNRKKMSLSGALFTRSVWKLQNHLYQIWFSGAF